MVVPPAQFPPCVGATATVLQVYGTYHRGISRYHRAPLLGPWVALKGTTGPLATSLGSFSRRVGKILIEDPPEKGKFWQNLGDI